jgi:hypothetical protein
MLHASGSGATGAAAQSVVQLPDGVQRTNIVDFGTGIVFVLVQVLCSVIAGVYNEHIIKGGLANYEHLGPSYHILKIGQISFLTGTVS